jgi:hypothetical protein
VSFLSTRLRSPLGRLVLVSLLVLPPSLAISVTLVWPVDGWFDRWGFVLGRDFVNFWFAARLAAEGRLGELYDLSAYHSALRAMLASDHPFMNFSYMPNALVLFRPLGALPYGAALAVWQLAGLAAFSFAATGKLLPPDRDRTVLVLLSPIVILTLSLAQATLLLALLFVGAFRLLPSRPGLAGVLFGLMTVKPQLGLLIPFVLVLDRQWKAIAAAVLFASLLAALSVALYGTEPWQAYLANTVPYQARVVAEPFGLVWTMMITPYAFLCQVGVAPALALKLHGAIALTVAAAALVAVRLSREASAKATIVALAAVLITPYSLAYDLAIPAAALIWHLGSRPHLFGALGNGAQALFWALPVLLMPLNVLGVPVMPLVLLALFSAYASDALGLGGEADDGRRRAAPGLA